MMLLRDEREIDAALSGLERRMRQARTPRKRRAAVADAERLAGDAARFDPSMVDVAAMLRQIGAGVLPFPEWRAELVSRVAASRSSFNAYRARKDDAFAEALILAG